MKKRVISLALVALMLLSVVGVVSVSAQTSATTSLDPNAENGYTYTASTSGIYRITYLNGAYNPWPPNSGPGDTWRNSIYIYLNRPISGVKEGACDYQLGAISGYYSTAAQAEAAAKGTYVDIPMKAGDYIILLIPDDQGCYGDNQGGITVSIELNAPPPNQAPDVSNAKPSVSCLWPVNHKFVDVTINGVTDPNGQVTISITKITSDEKTATAPGAGGATHSPDAFLIHKAGVDDTAQLRAERSGTGNGRVYVISFTATDVYGATTQGTVKVVVPHDQSTPCKAIDDGQLYDATV